MEITIQTTYNIGDTIRIETINQPIEITGVQIHAKESGLSVIYETNHPDFETIIEDRISEKIPTKARFKPLPYEELLDIYAQAHQPLNENDPFQ